MTTETVFTCPECGSERVCVTAEQMFFVNTGEHWCHSVKTQDDEAKATCLDCRWEGHRPDLKVTEAPPKKRSKRK
jgi:transcription elongation factor Elf1